MKKTEKLINALTWKGSLTFAGNLEFATELEKKLPHLESQEHEEAPCGSKMGLLA